MKTIKILGAILIASSILGLGMATSASAEVVKDQNKDTQTNVEILDNTDPSVDTDLQLVKVPSQFDFKTKLQSGDEYTITGGTNEGTNKEFEVFSNATQQAWSVRSVVAPTMKNADGTKTVDVTGLSFDTNSKGNAAKTSATVKAESVDGGIVMDSKNNPIGTDGHSVVELSSLAIKIKAADGTTIAMGDKYTGTMTSTLYNTVDAQ